MAEKQKNLCAMIPAELHSRVRTAQEESGLTLSAYMTELLTDYYEKGKGSEQIMSGVRTMAFSDAGGVIPAAETASGAGERPDGQKGEPEGICAGARPAGAGRGGAEGGGGQWR